MKKFFVLFLSLIIVSVSIMTGCSSEGEDRSEELNSALESTYKELTSTFSGESGQYDLVSQYLHSWASKNEIEIIDSEDTYMILRNPATEGSEDADSVALQCCIDTREFSTSLQSLALSLSSLLGPVEHGDIALIVTEKDNGEYTGATKIKTSQLKYDNFINITQNEEIKLLLSGSYSTTATMSTNISMSEPSYPNTYNITMKISGQHDPFSQGSSNYPNPVEVIGNLLASEKSSGQLFQLESFNCEVKHGYVPTSATAVVAIDSNDISSFEKKFKSSYNGMKKRFEKLEDNFVYTFTKTEPSEYVMSEENSDNIISLMYTLKTGSYKQEDAEESEDIDSEEEDSEALKARSEITSVSTKDGTFRLTTTFRSNDVSVLDEMSEVFLTTSGLCDIDYSRGNTKLTWPSKKSNKLDRFFINALGAEDTIYNTTLESTECDIFASKRKLRMISYQCNIHHAEAALTNITKYIESLVVE